MTTRPSPWPSLERLFAAQSIPTCGPGLLVRARRCSAGRADAERLHDAGERTDVQSPVRRDAEASGRLPDGTAPPALAAGPVECAQLLLVVAGDDDGPGHERSIRSPLSRRFLFPSNRPAGN